METPNTEQPGNVEQPIQPNASRRNLSFSTLLVGLFFWVIIIGGIFYVVWSYTHTKDADIMLDINGENIAVSVMQNGHSVQGGKVRLTYQDYKSRNFLGSSVLELGNNGTVSASIPDFKAQNNAVESLKLTASYFGTNHAGKPVSGDTSIYLNAPLPLNKWAFRLIYFCLGLFLLSQLFIFARARMTLKELRSFFFLMYFITITSIFAPAAISLSMYYNPDIVGVMESLPVSLVKGTTSQIKEPQWLLNLGGVLDNNPGEPSSGDTVTPAVTGTAGEAPAADAGTPHNNHFGVVHGGVSVPFYVIVLAMLGAGINMTLKVPKIQSIFYTKELEVHQTNTSGLEKVVDYLLLKSPDTIINTTAIQEVREELIKNYMYLLSAPVLAVAVYYLLQILGDGINEPILVVMAFATGLISDKVVEKIRNFAAETIKV